MGYFDDLFPDRYEDELKEGKDFLHGKWLPGNDRIIPDKPWLLLC